MAGSLATASHAARTRCFTTYVPHQISVSDKTDDPVWDTFLLKTPCGHYAQTSLWARAKASLGWRAVRIIISQEDHIVAGAQLLIRSLPIGGIIGYIPGGPCAVQDDCGLTKLVLSQIHQVTRRYRIQYLLVQPTRTSNAFAHESLHWGYEPCSRNVLAVATAILDLTQDLDYIFSILRKSTRRNIRLSQRKGVTVREGNESDLQIFYSLNSAACKRNNLSTFSEEYYTRLWQLLHSRGHLQLFIAEYAGEAVAASLVIAFGDTVTDTVGAWSGSHAKTHPNELLEWTVIAWAKSQGYRYIDFDGINPAVARNELTPNAVDDGATFFKLGFGGKAVLCQQAYEYLPNPFLHWAYRACTWQIVSKLVVQKLENFIRGMHSS